MSKFLEILGSTSYVTICTSRSNTHFRQFYLVEHLLQLWYSYVLLYLGNNVRCKLRKASECTEIIMSRVQLLTYFWYHWQLLLISIYIRGSNILQVLLDSSETMFLSSRPLHFVNVQ